MTKCVTQIEFRLTQWQLVSSKKVPTLHSSSDNNAQKLRFLSTAELDTNPTSVQPLTIYIDTLKDLLPLKVRQHTKLESSSWKQKSMAPMSVDNIGQFYGIGKLEHPVAKFAVKRKFAVLEQNLAC
jgi:hypothetical protein